MSMLEIFTAIENSAIGEVIRSSTWAFAAIEVVHLLGLTVLIGTVLVVSLRLFGTGLNGQSTQDIAALTLPWTYLGIIVTIGSGVFLFISEAVKCYENPPFFVKMAFLALALVSTFATHRRLASGAAKSTGLAAKFAGGVMIALWLGVGFAGRAIAFY